MEARLIAEAWTDFVDREGDKIRRSLCDIQWIRYCETAQLSPEEAA